MKRLLLLLPILAGLASAQTTQLTPFFRQQFFTSTGAAASGYKVCSYQAGTTTPLNTYTDQTGSVANANPVILGSDGAGNIWLLNRAYKLVLMTPGTDNTCSTGSVVKSVDNVNPFYRYTGTVAPVSGTYQTGDFVWNTAPAAGNNGTLGWVNTAGGSPGTWSAIATLAPSPSFSDAFYMLPAGACTMAPSTGAVASYGGTGGYPQYFTNGSNLVILDVVTTAAASVLQLTCDITGAGRTTTGKGITSISSIDVFYGLQTTALTSISAPTLQTNTFPAVGAAAGNTQASAGGSLTVTPGTLQLATTTYPNCYHENIALGTPISLNTGSQKVELGQAFNQTAASVEQVYICGVQVNYTWVPF